MKAGTMDQIARNAPADNAKLSAHFAALADRYAAEARRHTVMAQSAVGNPNRSTGGGMSMHCKRLAELNTQSAATLRELAVHHKALAAGAASTPPEGGAQYQGGAGASTPTESDLKALAAKAATPAAENGADWPRVVWGLPMTFDLGSLVVAVAHVALLWGVLLARRSTHRAP